MKLLYTLASAALLAMSALNASAAGTVTFQIDPAPGEYDELPSNFTVTPVFEGETPTTIAKNSIGGNPLTAYAPGGASNAYTATFNASTGVATCTRINTANFSTKESGEYKVTLKKDWFTFTWADGTKTKNVATDFMYTIKGEGGGGDDETTKEVAYDIKVVSTVPAISEGSTFDIVKDTFEGVQIMFSLPNLNVENTKPVVKLTGPNFNETVPLKKTMTTATQTTFVAFFSKNAKYNGEYTLSIPQGVLGDATWLEDHQYGHSNAAVNIKFNCEGGEDPSSITTDLTFNPVVTPGVDMKVPTLETVSLDFDTTPYWNANATLSVQIREDLQGDASAFGSASIQKGEGNKLTLVLNPVPTKKAQYLITVPEATFWDQAHQTDNNAGKLNGELELRWYLVPEVPKANVTGHVPATDAKVASFEKDKPGIIINTDNNAVVAKLEVEVVGYELGNDSAMPKTVVNATSTDKTEDGAICWINKTGSTVQLNKDYYYEVNYTIYDSSNNELANGMWEFDGDESTGVKVIEGEGAQVIFNIQGVRVNNTEALPAGLYIINGRKTVVK